MSRLIEKGGSFYLSLNRIQNFMNSFYDRVKSCLSYASNVHLIEIVCGRKKIMIFFFYQFPVREQ